MLHKDWGVELCFPMLINADLDFLLSKKYMYIYKFYDHNFEQIHDDNQRLPS